MQLLIMCLTTCIIIIHLKNPDICLRLNTIKCYVIVSYSRRRTVFEHDYTSKNVVLRYFDSLDKLSVTFNNKFTLSLYFSNILK